MKSIKCLPKKLNAKGKNVFFLLLFLVSAMDTTAISVRSFVGKAKVYPKGYDLRTASNDRYDPEMYTFAGSNFGKNDWVKIVNQENGLTVYAQQNDQLRAPERYSYIAKLSEAVAQDLRMEHEAQVQVERVSVDEVPARYFERRVEAPRGSMNDGTSNGSSFVIKGIKQFDLNHNGGPIDLSNKYGIQLISLTSSEAALDYADLPNVKALGEVYWETHLLGDKLFYRVMIGRFETPAEAERAAKKFRAAGFDKCKARIYE